MNIQVASHVDSAPGLARVLLWIVLLIRFEDDEGVRCTIYMAVLSSLHYLYLDLHPRHIYNKTNPTRTLRNSQLNSLPSVVLARRSSTRSFWMVALSPCLLSLLVRETLCSIIHAMGAELIQIQNTRTLAILLAPGFLIPTAAETRAYGFLIKYTTTFSHSEDLATGSLWFLFGLRCRKMGSLKTEFRLGERPALSRADCSSKRWISRPVWGM